MSTNRPIFLTNTYGHRREEFQPRDAARVTMYTCGPTVYNYAHIGNFRAFLMADTMRRTLMYNGYNVLHVRNITDVGHLTNDTLGTGIDRIEKSARESNSSPWDIANYFAGVFLEDAARLNLLEPHHQPRATRYIPEMITLAERLVETGHAYASAGNVYYDVGSFSRYGALSGNTVEQLVAGSRVEPGEDKKSPADFALWKTAEADRIMRWDSPWGEGVPGWHLECSAMSSALLGDQIDIHTGGIDNIFPHHEDEIAQSEAVANKRFSRYWLHSAWLQIGEEKMAKSAGVMFTLADLSTHGVHPLAYRYFTYQAHYRSPLTFSWDALQAAQTGLFRVWEATAEWVQAGGRLDLSHEGLIFQERFHEAINGDLDMPAALVVLHDVIGAKLPTGEKMSLMADFDRVLGLDLLEMASSLSLVSDEERAQMDERAAARQAKDWIRSDEIRRDLAAHGLDVKDTASGQRWVRREVPSARGGNDTQDNPESCAQSHADESTDRQSERSEDGV
ncbi:MAG: cysteine--tRNA ligase [Chloroflexota bacterium]